jgi:hypothetical protein
VIHFAPGTCFEFGDKTVGIRSSFIVYEKGKMMKEDKNERDIRKGKLSARLV